MTVLGALAKRATIENPNVPLTNVSLVDWLTGGERSLAQIPVNEKRVYGLTAYLRAMSLLSGTMASLPLKVYRNGTRERVMRQTVLDSPNPRQTPFQFWQTLIMGACGWGNAYARKVRNNADVVVELWPIHPSRVSTNVGPPTSTRPDGLEFLVVDDDGKQVTLSSWELFHLAYLSPDGVSGLSPLRAARESLGVGIAAENQTARFFGQGTHLSGVLQTKNKLGVDEAERLKARWRDKISQPKSAFEIAVLDAGAEFKPISVSPADAQLLDSRKFTVVEIARMFGIPPHLLGDVERSTSWGTGIEQQAIGFVVYTLQPWLTMIEQRVTRELLPGGWSSGSWYAEYTLEGLLRGDSQTRSRFYASAIQWGWMNRNEARVRENLEPAAGLDEFLAPSNMTIFTIDGKPVALGGTDVTSPQEAA